jgi:hypothetical protein
MKHPVKNYEGSSTLDKVHPIGGTQVPSLINWYQKSVPCFWKLGEYIDESLNWCLVLEITPPHIPAKNCTFHLEEGGRAVGGTFVLPTLIVHTDYQNGHRSNSPRSIAQKAVSKSLMGSKYGQDSVSL